MQKMQKKNAGVQACCRMSTASPTVIIASFSAFLKEEAIGK
jgi:hypothetical protein